MSFGEAPARSILLILREDRLPQQTAKTLGQSVILEQASGSPGAAFE
jgi:hypothetical protein